MKSPYSSIKVSSYFQVYEDLFQKFRGKNITFVEIGVLNGGSLFMWRDFFGSKARIIGIDLNPIAKKWEKDGFEIFIGSQSSQEFWNVFFKKVGNVDIILDDGGHTNEQQILTSVNVLNHIKDKGLLVIEDVCTSYMTRYGNPSRYSFIEFSKNLIDNINGRFPSIKTNSLPWKKLIYSINFYESIVCFNINRKKCFESKLTKNKGISVNAENFTHKNDFLYKTKIKSKYFFYLYLKIKDLKLKKFF